MDFDGLAGSGSAGSVPGGFVVYGDDVVRGRGRGGASNFLWVESCGQCPACKLGRARSRIRLVDCRRRATPSSSRSVQRAPVTVTDGSRRGVAGRRTTDRRQPASCARSPKMSSRTKKDDCSAPPSTSRSPKIVDLAGSVSVTYDGRQAPQAPRLDVRRPLGRRRSPARASVARFPFIGPRARKCLAGAVHGVRTPHSHAARAFAAAMEAGAPLALLAVVAVVAVVARFTREDTHMTDRHSGDAAALGPETLADVLERFERDGFTGQFRVGAVCNACRAGTSSTRTPFRSNGCNGSRARRTRTTCSRSPHCAAPTARHAVTRSCCTTGRSAARRRRGTPRARGRRTRPD